jgi:hypothetical protein
MADNQPDSQLLRLRMQIDQIAPEAPELAAAATRLLDLMERYRRQLESPEFRATLLSCPGQPQTRGRQFKLARAAVVGQRLSRARGAVSRARHE